MAFIHSPKIVTDGLVLYLDAANRKSYPGSGVTWNDLSGNGVNTTLVNGPTFVNDGIVIDGVDDYGIFNTSNFPSGNSPFTIEIVFSSQVNNGTIMFGYGQDIGPSVSCPILTTTADSKVIFTFGSNVGNVLSTSTIITNRRYHAFAIYTGTQTQMYVNGTLENVTNYSSANILLNNGINGNFGLFGGLFSIYGNVGSGTTQRYGTFSGNVTIAKIYNRALSANEVLQNFNATRGRFGV